MDDRIFFLGIDGGGSGCRARLTDSRGYVLGEGRAGPATLRLGAETAWNAIIAAVQDAMASARIDVPFSQIYAGLALAGASRTDNVRALRERAAAFAGAEIISDGLAACLGAHAGADGGIVSVGTGSIAIAIAGGTQIRIGGYGLPVSDEGSGADIGVQAMRHMMRVVDGLAQRSAFTDQILQGCGGNPSSVADWINHAHASDYAALAPLVFAHANKGDEAARNMIRNAGAVVSELVLALRNKNVARIALTGGLAAPLMPWLMDAARAVLTPAAGDALDGALIVARRLAAY